MGAEPWSSFTKFDTDIQRALDKLRGDVFAAGAYRYAEENPSSIEEAREIADAVRRRFSIYSESLTNLIFSVRHHFRLTN